MSSRYPPGPRDWLLGLGQLRKLRADVLGYSADLARTYGDVVYLRFGPYEDYVFYHPDAIREVLVTKAKHFVKMSTARQVMGQLDGNGLVFSEGDFWLRQRRLVQPAFHARRFGGYTRVMVERTRQMLHRWRQQAGPAGRLELDAEKAMTSLTLIIAGETFFGVDVSATAVELGRAVAIMSEVFTHELSSPMRLPDWLPLPAKRRKKWAIHFLDESVRRFIRERRASGEDRGDLLSMLLVAVDAEGDGKGMTDEQARDEVMTLFMAGHDTSAASLTWVWYVLTRHAAVFERAVAEVDRELGGRPATAEDLPSLPYLERVVKETLRLYPPAVALFLRESTSDLEIGGYRLRKGSLVQMFPYVTHRDPRWFPEPEQFDPDRFLPERMAKLPPFAYFPFGGGPRVCIGSSFAMLEIVLVMATILQQLRIQQAPGQTKVALLPQLSLRPKGGLPVAVTVR